jgi:hypothetical protein
MERHPSLLLALALKLEGWLRGWTGMVRDDREP